MGPAGPLRALAGKGALPSLILWGPPGTGKTTLARLLAEAPGTRFVPHSAVAIGVKEIRELVELAAREARSGRRTVLFLDEIHRFNRAQQDVLLPHVEIGTITLIGATTENPSFEVNAALLSRCRVFTLRRLETDALGAVVRRAGEDKERGLGADGLQLSDAAVAAIAEAADGDARRALNLLEAASALHKAQAVGGAALSVETIALATGARVLAHDRDREDHYNVVSALIKSLRASDPDAALYYMARMLAAGEDPLFVARRLVIFASEDVGNADPAALRLCLDAKDAYHFLGTPEGELALAQAVCYLALAPKSNAVYVAWNAVRHDIQEKPAEPVPLHLRNAPTGLMANLGYGRGYQYAHDAPDAQVSQEHLPDGLRGRVYYRPTNRGAEKDIAERLARWRAWREKQKRE